jgi:hypothetical protein
MTTTYTVQQLAQKYAESLVEFYELDLHVTTAGVNALREDVAQLRVAREAMYGAQSALNEACQHQAHMNYA